MSLPAAVVVLGPAWRAGTLRLPPAAPPPPARRRSGTQAAAKAIVRRAVPEGGCRYGAGSMGAGGAGRVQAAGIPCTAALVAPVSGWTEGSAVWTIEPSSGRPWRREWIRAWGSAVAGRSLQVVDGVGEHQVQGGCTRGAGTLPFMPDRRPLRLP